MALRYLLDEHFRGPVWDAVLRHNALGVDPIDAERVGDPVDLPLGISDAEILIWADREQRVLVTEDKTTMPGHLAAHLAAGGHSPGVMVTRPHVTPAGIVRHLVLAAHASDPVEWENQATFIP